MYHWNSIIGGDGTYYGPPKIELKLPAAKSKAEWTNDSIKYTATWTTAIFNGKEHKAIKVIGAAMQKDVHHDVKIYVKSVRLADYMDIKKVSII